MLSNNPTQMDSYNKHSKGTLVANWYEERVHLQNKGEARAMTQTHYPKKHAQILESNNFKPRKEDDTKYRIIGDHNNPINRSENYHYGKGTNKADLFPTRGKKQQLLEQMYLKKITSIIEQEQQQIAKKDRQGQFTTTQRDSFAPKTFDCNRIGRKIMREQTGKPIDFLTVEEQLMVSNGLKERGQITPDEELRKLIDTDTGYERQQPITFWKEKTEDNSFYMSKAKSIQPFGKNNEFLRTFQQYKHYKD